MQSPRQPAKNISQLPPPSGSNSNRDKKLLETVVSYRKHMAWHIPNRSKIAILFPARDTPFLNAFLKSDLLPLLPKRQLPELEINPSHTKQSASFFLIDDFCALSALRSFLRSAFFVPLNPSEEQFS